MSIPKGEVVVLDIAGTQALVVCNCPKALLALVKLGFKKEGEQLQRSIADSKDRERLVNDLIHLKALFSAGRDWSPAELVDFYREQGTVTTGYRRISWTKPDQYEIVDR